MVQWASATAVCTRAAQYRPRMCVCVCGKPTQRRGGFLESRSHLCRPAPSRVVSASSRLIFSSHPNSLVGLAYLAGLGAQPPRHTASWAVQVACLRKVGTHVAGLLGVYPAPLLPPMRRRDRCSGPHYTLETSPRLEGGRAGLSGVTLHTLRYHGPRRRPAPVPDGRLQAQPGHARPDAHDG